MQLSLRGVCLLQKRALYWRKRLACALSTCAYNIYQSQKWYFCYHLVQHSYSNQLLTQSKVLNKTDKAFLFNFFK